MKRVVILTGSELRHTFFRKAIALSDQIEIVQTYCEGLEKSLGTFVKQESGNDLRTKHLHAREQSELDFFGLFLDSTADRSKPLFLPKGEINSPKYVEAILKSDPDLLIAYGCSIVREPLLSAFPRRFLNVHLGLSPYYRGSGTNYWPLVNREPEYVGATFMHIDSGVDSGEVIHQVRARIAPGDSAVQIGNRLILDMTQVYLNLILRFDQLKAMPQIPSSPAHRYYKKKDYSEESVATLYQNFCDGMIDEYLRDQKSRCAAVSIVENPALVRPIP